MQLRRLVPVFLHRPLLRFFCIALNSCQSHKANSGPSIEFLHIPPAAQNGRERVDTISGRGKKRSTKRADCYLRAQRAVVGAALDGSSLHSIKEDPTWSTKAHLGFVTESALAI
jgi:hypothetical protein